jgi:hypothetical protein
VCNAVTLHTERNQGCLSNNQLPKKRGGKGQLFSAQTPKKKKTSDLLVLLTEQIPQPPSSILCKTVFGLFIGFCILSFSYRLRVTPEK